jgi:hypothetical protein
MCECCWKRPLRCDEALLASVDAINIIGVDVGVLEWVIIVGFKWHERVLEREDVIVAVEFLDVGMEVEEVFVMILCLGKSS